ncbi:MAG: aminoacetone oxidase family FAD-binding enzyme [Bacillota bacterium]
MKTFEIVILGGGASGVCTALMACKKYSGTEIAIVEGGERLMRKLAQTGNGRGNITNKALHPQKFFGDDCSYFIENFNLQNTLDFFTTLGIETTSIGNKIFPRSFSASSFVDLLRFSIARENINVFLSHQISTVKKVGSIFKIQTSSGEISAKKIVVALGGCACPHLNTDGFGVKILKSLGHSSTALHPALVQLKTTSQHTKTLKGIKSEVVATFSQNGKPLATFADEMHFSEFALSGPVSFLLSTFSAPFKNGVITVDFLPDTNLENLVSALSAKANLYRDCDCETLLFTTVANQIARCIIKEACLNGKKISQISNADIIKIAKITKSFAFDFVGNLSFAKAQSTVGGVPLAEFDKNLQSIITPNLFACGEALNVCGECGGFNLQWAWSSAFAVSEGL